jgi:mono/diheme cytochrome c family protein
MRIQLSIAFGALALLSIHLGVGLAQSDPRTERAWRGKCAPCHGDNGKAETEQGKKMAIADLTSSALQKTLTDDRIKKAILDGINETRDGKAKQMDAFRDQLRPEQVDALVKYVRGLQAK